MGSCSIGPNVDRAPRGPFAALARRAILTVVMVTSRVTLLTLVLVQAACNDPTVAKRLSELEAKAKALEESTARDQRTAKAVEERMARVEKLSNGDNRRLDLLTDELLETRKSGDLAVSEAIVSCKEKGYSLVRTTVGSFLVSCSDLKPRGDGCKIALLVGNPHLVALNGFSLKVRYGSRDAGTDPSWSPRATTVRFAERLRPGTWSRVTMALAPCKADDSGFLSVAMSVGQVVLNGRAVGR